VPEKNDAVKAAVVSQFSGPVALDPVTYVYALLWLPVCVTEPELFRPPRTIPPEDARIRSSPVVEHSIAPVELREALGIMRSDAAGGRIVRVTRRERRRGRCPDRGECEDNSQQSQPRKYAERHFHDSPSERDHSSAIISFLGHLRHATTDSGSVAGRTRRLSGPLTRKETRRPYGRSCPLNMS